MSLALWGYPGLVNGIIECTYSMCNLWNMMIIISQAIYSGALGSWDAEFLDTSLLVKMLMSWSPWFSACIQLYFFVNSAQVFLICVRLKHACLHWVCSGSLILSRVASFWVCSFGLSPVVGSLLRWCWHHARGFTSCVLTLEMLWYLTPHKCGGFCGPSWTPTKRWISVD